MIFTSRWPVAKVNRQRADFPVRSNLRICEVSSMVVGSRFNRCCGLESPRSDSSVCNRGGDFESALSAGAENSSVQGFEPIGIDGSQASLAGYKLAAAGLRPRSAFTLIELILVMTI